VCRQLVTTQSHPIYPRILTRQNPSTKVQKLRPKSPQTLRKGLYCYHSREKGESGPAGQFLPQSRLDQREERLARWNQSSHRFDPVCRTNENALKARKTLLHLRRGCRTICPASRSTCPKTHQQTRSKGLQSHLAGDQPKANSRLHSMPQKNPSRRV
jgi:hypothetical protein